MGQEMLALDQHTRWWNPYPLRASVAGRPVLHGAPVSRGLAEHLVERHRGVRPSRRHHCQGQHVEQGRLLALPARLQVLRGRRLPREVEATGLVLRLLLIGQEPSAIVKALDVPLGGLEGASQEDGGGVASGCCHWGSADGGDAEEEGHLQSDQSPNHISLEMSKYAYLNSFTITTD